MSRFEFKDTPSKISKVPESLEKFVKYLIDLWNTHDSGTRAWTTISAGTETLNGNLSFVSTSTQGVVGTTTNDNAAAGNVGEVIQSQIGSGSAISLVSGTAKNVTSISCTAGHWKIDGIVGYITGGTVSWFQQCVSTTSATCNNEQTNSLTTFASAITPSIGQQNFPTCPGTFKFASTTTVYLVAQAAFGTSCTTYGTITATRVR